jgi:hypothetical protein
LRNNSLELNKGSSKTVDQLRCRTDEGHIKEKAIPFEI